MNFREMLNTNANDFKKEVTNNDLVLVDFYATWCGPCKMVAPVIEEINTKHSDIVKVLKVNVDEERQLAAEFNITAIPTLVLIKGGKVVNRMMGFRTKDAILETIKNYK